MDSPSDRERDLWRACERFRVLRFWDNVVLRELENVEEAILAALEEADAPLPNPPPRGGRGQTPVTRLRHNTLPYL